MENLFRTKFPLLVCVLVLGVVSADKDEDVKAFKELKEVVFGPTKNPELQGKHLSWKIHKIIALLTGGNIPPEVQGEITLDYLNDLASDCEDKDFCNLKDDLARTERLHKRVTGSPNFRTYLSTCNYYILRRCADTVYNQAREKLSILNSDEQHALDRFAVTLDYELTPKVILRPAMNGFRRRIVKSELNYHVVVLKSLKGLDPEFANKLTKVFINRKKFLRSFMDRIRQSCSTFLQNLDPFVEWYPATESYTQRSKDPIGQVCGWRFIQKACESVIAQWDNIVLEAEKDYKQYLADPKEEKVHWWSGYGDSSGGGGGGVTTGTLLKISAGR